MSWFSRRPAEYPCLIVACVTMFFWCAPKEKSTGIIGMVGNDTLTMTMVRDILPDSAIDSARIGMVAMQIALSQQTAQPESASQCSTLVNEMRRRLMLRSNEQWNDKSAMLLYKAGTALRDIIRDVKKTDSVVARLDSLYKRKVGIGDLVDTTTGRAVFPYADIGKGLPDSLDSPDALRQFVGVIFNLSNDAARTAVDFLFVEPDTAGAEDVSEIIKNLIYDKAAHEAAKETAVATLPKRDNSEQVLKFRNQQSIQDSIVKHQVNIQALYKKILKMHAGISGVVWVEFRVNPAGAVLSAKISSAEIDEKEFVNPFLEYIKTIRFQPVAAKLGNMTFTFPFEFSPEG